jgi:hypothetical protein
VALPSIAWGGGSASLGYGALLPPSCSGGAYCRTQWGPALRLDGTWAYENRYAFGGMLDLYYGGLENLFLMIGPTAGLQHDLWFARLGLGVSTSWHSDADGGPGSRIGPSISAELGIVVADYGDVTGAITLAASALWHDTGVPGKLVVGYGVHW